MLFIIGIIAFKNESHFHTYNLRSITQLVINTQSISENAPILNTQTATNALSTNLIFVPRNRIKIYKFEQTIRCTVDKQ
jgi:uncharacterized protein (UPF0333 family)